MTPNLFIIGAPKSGTTALSYYLNQHPDIFIPKRKEIHYFDDDRIYKKGVSYYLRLYTSENVFLWRGDATPNYMPQYLKVIPRLKKFLKNGEAKFIIILRNPVFRAWSHYLHMKRIGYEQLNFDQALEREKKRLMEKPGQWFGYFQEGLYSEQLKNWFDAFGRENFIVLRQDLLKNSTQATVSKVFDFLDINSNFLVKDVSLKNIAGIPRNKLVMRILAGNFHGADIIKKYLPISNLRELRILLRKLNSKDSTKCIMPDEFAVKLQKKYKNDLKRVEELLDWNLIEWMK